jgi:transglutaminase-like putative cysteine protease
VRLRIVHATTYEYVDPVTMSLHDVHLTPRAVEGQAPLAHEVTVAPMPRAIFERTDYFGNQARSFSLQEPHRSLRIVATSEVRRDDRRQLSLSPRSPSWEMVRDRLARDRRPDALVAYGFTFASRYVRPDAALREYALPSFPPGRPLLEAARDLTRRIHAEFKYEPGATDISTPLADVLRHRRGVCQDFAHLEIGCLRALGLPGRYVSGYLMTTPPAGKARVVGADASHAWASTYSPDVGWVDFDPANDVVPSDRHVTVAYGCDFGDVTPVRGVILGGARHTLRVEVDVVEVPELVS